MDEQTIQGLESSQETTTQEIDTTYQNQVITMINNIQIMHVCELFLLFVIIGALISKSLWSKVNL